MWESPESTERAWYISGNGRQTDSMSGLQGTGWRVPGNETAEPSRGHLPAFQALGISCILNLSLSASFFLSSFKHAQVSSILKSFHLEQ